MYTLVKDKFMPQSPRQYSNFHRVVPRHTKAYIWLCFLILVFGYMLLLDNGISLSDLLLRIRGSYAETTTSTPSAPYVETVNSTSRYNRKPELSPIAVQPELPQGTKTLTFGKGSTAFTPDDVVILFKTGATSLWHRVPIHLSTSLSDQTLTPNVVFYSDQEDQIAGRPIIDVLANISSTLKSTSDFDLYRNLKELRSKNLYLESATIEGDHYLPGGWRLDKYKFLPLMSHAALTYPDKKWYIYMEDDNYFFWHSLYTWLSTFDPLTPIFLGSPAARLGEDFAHGGSGVIVSSAAMAKTFGSNPNLASEWESYAQQRCCGDQVLSHVMAVNGVPRDRRYDHTGWAALQALSHTHMAFGHWNWCSPLFNVHKVHQADVSRLHLLEKEFHADLGPSEIMTWGHLFNRTVAQGILSSARRLEWDNGAAEKWFSSSEADQALTEPEREASPWFSADACEAACRAWSLCLSWKYADDNCGLSSTVVEGRPVDEGIALTSGYLLDKVRDLTEKTCPDLGYGS